MHYDESMWWKAIQFVWQTMIESRQITDSSNLQLQVEGFEKCFEIILNKNR